MLLKSCLPGYLLLILIVLIGQFDRLQCAALDPATPTNSVTKVIKKPPLHHLAASSAGNASDLIRSADLVESSDKPAGHKSTGALPGQPSKLTSEQAASTASSAVSTSSAAFISSAASISSVAPTSSVASTSNAASNVVSATSSPIHNSHKLDKIVELDRPELVKRAENEAKQREAEESSLERQLLAQKLSGPNEDNKLRRTKRRGRIGGKASSSGIGHGRTGARQDTANSTPTSNTPAFMLYALVLFCSPLLHLKVAIPLGRH